jgi:hypothetical protein
MAASATGSVKVTLSGELKNTLTDGQTVSATIGTSPSLSLATGTGANQFNRGWQSKGRVLASTSENIDMYDLGSLDIGAGAGEDALGLSLAATAVVAICVENRAVSAVNLLVGGLSATTAWNNPFNGDDDAKLSIPPNGGVMLWAVGATAFAVADTTNHLLKIEAAGGSATYDICVFFRG